MSMVVYLRRMSATELADLTAEPDRLHEIVFEEDARDRVIDFDKAWHALHFMLTGDAGSSDHPLSLLVASDAELIGTDSQGFGGYWLAEPSRVKRFAEHLNDLSDEELADCYDPSAMIAEYIYLSDLFEEEGAEALDYVMQGVPALRRFAKTAADADDFIIGLLS